MKSVEGYPLLEQMMKLMSSGKNFHICIHDTSGILHNNPYLAMSPTGYSHNHPFCTTAKLTSRGFKNCLRCKALSLKMALNSREPFIGQCYLGQTEIIKPVYVNDRLACVIYLGNLLDKKQREAVIKKIKRNAPRTGVLPRKLLKELEATHEFDMEETDVYFEILELINNFIILINAQYQKPIIRESDTAPIFRGNIHSAVRTVMDYVSIHYNLDIQLEQLAKICFLNPEYLSKLFKKETGSSLVDYINFIRMERAKDSLIMTNDEIVNIALQAGFNSSSYFCRVFKRSTGLSPTGFRRQNRNIGQ